jgi:predicted DNA-binding protein
MISLGAERIPKIGIGVYVEPPLHDRLEKTAKECGTSISVFCRTAIMAYMADLEEESDLERDRR